MRRWLPLATVLLSISCSSGGSSTPTTPSSNTPPLPPTSETFTGTVSPGSSDSHTFTVALSNGQLTADLTAAGPPVTIFMGLGIGMPTNGVCTLLTGAAVIVQASPAAQLSGTVNAGAYCVMVYDAGNQVGDVGYSVTVTHY
jgi:hypothetical protein